jgi:hypothetical protein
MRIFFAYKLEGYVIERKLCSYDPLLGWRGIPYSRAFLGGASAEVKDFEVSLNGHGFRDYDYSYDKPEDKKRIVILGDSFVMGLPLSFKDIFSKKLEKKLADWQVINLGIAGYSSDQELLVLKESGLRYKPDIVLLGLFLDDILDNNVDYLERRYFKPRFFINDKGKLLLVNDELPLIKNSSFFLSFLLQRWYVFRTKLRLAKFGIHPKYGTWELDVFNRKFYDSGGYQITLRLIREFKRICDKHNVEFILMIIPHQNQLYNRGFLEDKGLDPDLPQQVITRFCKENNILYLDLLSLFRERPRDPRIYFEHDLHWNTFGHELVAQEILNFLKCQKLIQ